MATVMSDFDIVEAECRSDKNTEEIPEIQGLKNENGKVTTNCLQQLNDTLVRRLREEQQISGGQTFESHFFLERI